MGWWIGRVGKGGADGLEGARGWLEERKWCRAVAGRLLRGRSEAQRGERGRDQLMSELRDGRLCGEHSEHPS